MKTSFVFCLIVLITSCGRGKQGKPGEVGSVIQGASAVSTGVDLVDIEPGLVCTAGGVSIHTFFDLDSDGTLDADENIIKVKSLCNGVDGEDGTSSTLTMEGFSSSAECPVGGVKISSNTSAPFEICNGSNGLNGEQGIQGVQGIPGIAGSNGAAGQDGAAGANGANGTSVIPVQFCADDKSKFPEFGLMIGDELFAVYWGTTPASPSKAQAFLAKLTPGKYQSTGGNNCIFLVE